MSRVKIKLGGSLTKHFAKHAVLISDGPTYKGTYLNLIVPDQCLVIKPHVIIEILNYDCMDVLIPIHTLIGCLQLCSPNSITKDNDSYKRLNQESQVGQTLDETKELVSYLVMDLRQETE